MNESSEAFDATYGETRSVVAGLDDLRRRARGHRRATSSPLFTFGVLTLLGAPLSSNFGWATLYWVLSIPVGFGFLAWRQRHRAARTGVGGGREPYGWFALGFWLLLFVPFGFFLVLTAPVAGIGAGLAFVAWQQRNLYLAVCALVFGVVGALEVPFLVVSNRLYDVADALGLYRSQIGYFEWSQQLVVGLLAAFLLAAGLVAWRREVRLQ